MNLKKKKIDQLSKEREMEPSSKEKMKGLVYEVVVVDDDKKWSLFPMMISLKKP